MYFTNKAGSSLCAVTTSIDKTELDQLFKTELEHCNEIMVDLDDVMSKLKLRKNNINTKVLFLDSKFNNVQQPPVCKLIIKFNGKDRQYSILAGTFNCLNTLDEAVNADDLLFACSPQLECLYQVHAISSNPVKKYMIGWNLGCHQDGATALKQLEGRKLEMFCGSIVVVKDGFLAYAEEQNTKHNTLQRLSHGKKQLEKNSDIQWREFINLFKPIVESLSLGFKCPESEFDDEFINAEAILKSFYAHETSWEKRIVANICLYELLTA